MAALIVRTSLNVGGEVALGHYTHEKNPVACAAALATLAVIEEESLVERARTLGEYALQRLRQMAERHPLISNVRGLGLLLGIELAITDPAGVRKPALDQSEQVMYEALKRGLNFKITMGNVLTLTPALIITQEELDRALEILEDCIGLAEATTHR